MYEILHIMNIADKVLRKRCLIKIHKKTKTIQKILLNILSK